MPEKQAAGWPGGARVGMLTHVGPVYFWIFLCCRLPYDEPSCLIAWSFSHFFAGHDSSAVFVSDVIRDFFLGMRLRRVCRTGKHPGPANPR